MSLACHVPSLSPKNTYTYLTRRRTTTSTKTLNITSINPKHITHKKSPFHFKSEEKKAHKKRPSHRAHTHLLLRLHREREREREKKMKDFEKAEEEDKEEEEEKIRVEVVFFYALFLSPLKRVFELDFSSLFFSL